MAFAAVGVVDDGNGNHFHRLTCLFVKNSDPDNRSRNVEHNSGKCDCRYDICYPVIFHKR